MDASWTISELSERVADALAASEELPGGKARAIPDERAIRYYTTLGLIDRATLKGRTAYYGARHLAQLIAIKKMQADGATLAEIQELLPAIDDARLAELTGVALAARSMPPARQDFWRAPALSAEPLPFDSALADASAALRANGEEAAASTGTVHPERRPSETRPKSKGPGTDPAPAADVDRPASFVAEHQLELMPGVRLSISASRVPTDADADAVRAAAAALLAELVRRRLV